MSKPPIIVLVNPQMGENIGAAARVMANFGVNELRIVSPRDGWPNPAAEAMAAHATGILKKAKIYDSVPEAVADCHHVIATSARERLMNKPICDAREWAAKPLAGKTAILFGRERTGLDNEEVALAHSLLTIPVNPDYASLNLAQSVGIICYEWFQQQGEHPARPNRARLATQAEVSDFLNQLENALDEVNFWRVAHKKPRMWRNLRSVFLRNELKSNEVLTLRGVVKSLRRK